MIFVIDIGNTHTVAGIAKSGKIIKKWRVKTDYSMTADELGISYHNLFKLAAIETTEVCGIVLSSVVPKLNGPLLECAEALFPGVDPNSIFNIDNKTVSNLINIRLDNPEEVGADRLVNGIAAYDLTRNATIVIDFGTAITFDCISEECEYLGGLILPGLNTALQALTERAAKLPQIDISTPPSSVIGKCTVSAMKSGVMHGYGSMIEGLVSKVAKEMYTDGTGDISVIATGGMAPVIKPFTPSVQIVEPDLTLKGLILIFKELTR